AELLPCVGAIHLYEILLLGITLTIVLWKRVHDDAVSLTILIALFLVVSGITVDTVANASPSAALWIGTGSFGLALVKLSALARLIRMPMGWLEGMGCALLLAWNFLMPGILAFLVQQDFDTPAQLRQAWLAGWIPVLTTLILFMIPQMRLCNEEKASPQPFLLTHGMTQVFLLILALAVNAHQYALAYVFDATHAFGDFLPVIGLTTLLLCVWMGRRDTGELTLSLIGVIPPLAALYAVGSGQFVAGPEWSLEGLWYPPIVLLLSGLGLGIHAILRREYLRLQFLFITLPILLLTMGAEPAVSPVLNWAPALLALAVLLLLAGAVHRRPILTLLGLGLTFCLSLDATWCSTWAQACHVNPLWPAALVAGGLTTLLSILRPTCLPRAAGVFGGALLAGALLQCLGSDSQMASPFLSGTLGLLLAILHYRLRHEAFTAITLCLPLTAAVYDSLHQVTGWHFVALSFLLLAGGSVLSLRKGASEDSDSDSLNATGSI
ncbi:MAG: hypothetical protein ACYTGH_02730, partial [Planctomycetota bacterium]